MAESYDLVSLPDYKAYMSISQNTDDNKLRYLITAISRAILTRINRPSLLPRYFTDIRDGSGEKAFFLRNWPVTSIVSLTIDGVAVPSAIAGDGWRSTAFGYVLDAPDMEPPGKPQMLSLKSGCYAKGRQNICVTYMAGYQTTEVINVRTMPPYSISLSESYGAWAKDISVTDVDHNLLTAVSENPLSGQYVASAGNYLFSSEDAGRECSITYGYIPADLAIAAMDWIADRASYQDRIGYSSKSLGGQETISYLVKSIPDFVQPILQQYTNVVQTC
ncbi:hypothetical protein [Beijerinckia indica]|uniref:Uncharacterized protein n=1 Tax=Beijerinckia indica subsp. indica (strain ATCC 9039 / DSM 1715 / NCIMB 8712) TaxID=395963 RepID=B2IFS7_BEII9|nr:hypothetical protein [Beijerinckia indica]ACB94288.1 hypothetical protein Bind_0638 [Beijerinckia indica subsp. indica ATCC 9039]